MQQPEPDSYLGKKEIEEVNEFLDEYIEESTDLQTDLASKSEVKGRSKVGLACKTYSTKPRSSNSSWLTFDKSVIP